MPRCEVHSNWVKLMQFCQKAGHGEMTLTFADGVPVFAKTVQVQMRFGPVHRGLRADEVPAPVLGAEPQDTRESDKPKR
jgi:hypothetical protein